MLMALLGIFSYGIETGTAAAGSSSGRGNGESPFALQYFTSIFEVKIMRIPEIATQSCPIARAIGLVGDTWTLMVLRELFLGTRRFDDLQRVLGISPHLLSVRLRELAAEGIIERVEYRAGRYEHSLTERGLDLWPVMLALMNWSDRWSPRVKQQAVRVRHVDCGKLTEAELHCSHCNGSIGPSNTQFEISPAAAAERRARLERLPQIKSEDANPRRAVVRKRA